MKGEFLAMRDVARDVARNLWKSLRRRYGRPWSFPRPRWEPGDGALGRYVVCSAHTRRCTFAVWVDRVKPGRLRTVPMLAVAFDLPGDPGLPTLLARQVRGRRMRYGMGEDSGTRKNAYGGATVIETDGTDSIYLARYLAGAPHSGVGLREGHAFFDRWQRLAEEVADGKWPPPGKSGLASRRRVRIQVLRRRGQPAFRSALIAAHGRRCVISGCGVLEVLEAAHVEGYATGKTHAIGNGLLLRADLHALFDLGLLGIDPDTMRVVLFGSLRKGEYRRYLGRQISSRAREVVDRRKLGEHLAWCRANLPDPRTPAAGEGHERQ